MDGIVNVAVRIRPTFNDNSHSSTIKLISENPWTLQVDDRSQYTVDHIFAENTGQLEIYNVIVKPLIEKVRSGYNSTVFAYGQTGTGKTYTMGSNPEAYETDEPGFILCSINNFIENLNDNTEVHVSFFEIYNERVYDLLSTNKTMLPIKGIQDLVKEKLIDLAQAKSILQRGSANRHVGETKQNSKSSRSHAILTIHFSTFNEGANISAKLNLVDLAGSESVKKTGNQGHQFQEGVNINKGLLSVGRVVNALATNVSFVPYRESKITTILQDSLNKSNYVTLVACISPNPDDVRETIQTMEFAQETRRIKNRPEVTSLLSTQKKKSVYSSFKRSIPHPQNLFNSSLKKPKLVDMACSPIKPFKKRLIEFNESSSATKVFSDFNFNVDTAEISPIVIKHVEKELAKLEESKNSVCGESVKENITQQTKIENEKFTPIIEKNDSQNLISSVIKSVKKSAEFKTPPSKRFSWRKLEALIAQTVRNEILQLTNRKPMACSSPINFQRPKKLDYKLAENDNKENFQFKIPVFPRETNNKYIGDSRRRKKHLVDTPSINGDFSRFIDNKYDEVESGRTEKLPTRRSERLFAKPVANKGSETYFFPEFNTVQKTKTRKKNQPASKNGDRIGFKQFFDDTANSPKTYQKKYILHLLNNGSEIELQKLATVGPKTATKIHTYRRINGQFKDIKDLERMTTIWRGKGFSRFLKENFIE